MKLMLIHLSDIHIYSQDDFITSRHSQIVDAVKNLDYSLDACVVIVTGDVAFSGSDEQYLVAMEFLDEIKQLLSAHLAGPTGSRSVPVHLVVIPGNHDCDFTVGGEVREILTNSVLGDYSKSEIPEVVQVCTAVQDSFFGFLKDVETLPRVHSHEDYDARLCYEYKLSIGEEHVKFLCYNTAWLSQLHEVQGHLFFPAKAVTGGHEAFDLVVAAFHHPYNWIESNAARSFRDRVESTADLILTGHEHVASKKGQEGHFRRHNICVEGGVLQESPTSEISEFNVFIFDTAKRKQKFGHFRWFENVYKLTCRSTVGDEGAGLGWTDYRANDFRSAGTFQLSHHMRDLLDDPGVALHHRDRGQLKLGDVFLYPDLVEIRNRGDRLGQRVSGDSVRDLLDTKSRLLITGDTESGKTCLSKMIFLDLLGNGVVPVLLDGTKKPPRGDRVYGYLEEAFANQFDSQLLDPYRQLDKSSRAIIIDDYDKLPLSPAQKKDFLNRLSLSSDRIIVFSHDISSDLEELTNPAGYLKVQTRLPIIGFNPLDM